MDKLVGQRLGPYRLLARVRSDGVTTVYKAHEPSPDRTVAVTLLSASLAQERTFGERLQREAESLAQLRHAHIVLFYDHGQIDGRPYLVTGYVEGQTLRERLRERALPLAEANRIMGQVGAALDYAHQLGVIHGDVRPGNVLLDAEGRTFLTNFGLASIIGRGGAPGWLGVGVGAPAYVSPEQGKGQPVDARSDVYSLGVTLYRMTTGRLPHQAETPLGMVLQHIDELPPLPRTIQPALPEDVEQVILRAMAPEPDHRFQEAGEMVQALDEAVQAAEPLSRGIGRRGPSPHAGQGPTRRLGFGWVPSIGWSALMALVGGIVLLLLLFALARPPIRVQVDGGQVEVVRVIERTATPPAAVGAARPTSTSTPEPTGVPTSTATPTATPRPYVTTTPLAFATNTPLPPVVNEQARAFAEPILAAIGDRPPDFGDDFEPGDSEWTWETTDVALDDVDYGIVDGVARMELVDEGTIKLRHPGLETTDFVLSVESQQIAGTSGSEQQIFLHFAETYFNFTLESGTRNWWAGVPWHPDGSIDGEGGVVHPMGETNRILLMVKGEQLAVYLNDVPVLYLEEPNLHASHRISFWCHGVPDVNCEFDNVQLWELEE